MEGIEQNYLAIYDLYRHPNDEEKEKANAGLLELYANPLIFHLLSSIALNHQDANFRFFTLLAIEKAIKFREKTEEISITPEEAQIIMQFILQFLQKQNIERDSDLVVTIGCNLAVQALEKEQYAALFSELPPQLIQMFIEMTQNPNFFLTSLTIGSQLLDYGILDEEILTTNNFAELFMNLILQGFSLEGVDKQSVNIRLHALKLLCSIKISQYDMFNDFMKSTPALLQGLQHMAQISVCENEDEEESLRVFQFLEMILTVDPDELGGSFSEFYAFCSQKIADVNVTPEIRENILQFFIGIILSSEHVEFYEANITPLFDDMICPLIELTYNILCCKCEQDPELFQPFNSDKLLEAIANDPDCTDLVYASLMDKTIEAQKEGNPVAFKTGISCLSMIVEEAPDAFSCHSEEVDSIIIAAFETEEPLIYGEICNFVHLLSQSSFDTIHPIFDQIIQHLLKHIDHHDSLTCLERLLQDSQQPPSDYSSLTQQLISFINPNTASVIVQCISNIVESMNDMDEDFYSSLREVLIQIIQTCPDARSSVYECFGNCTKIAPQIIGEDIITISGTMIQDLSSEPNLDLIAKTSLAISEIVRMIPQTFQEPAPHFFEAFSTFLGQNSESAFADTVDDEFGEIGEIQRTCGNTLIALCDLLVAYPDQFTPQAGTLIETIGKFLTSQLSNLIIGAAQSIIAITPLLSPLQVDPNTFIDPIITIINVGSKSDDGYDETVFAINDLLSALTSILFQFGSSITGEVVLKVGSFFTECLDLKVANILDDHQKSIENEYIDNVIYSIEAFIFGGAFSNYPGKEALIQLLVRTISDSHGKMLLQSYAVLTLAEICYTMPAESIEAATKLVQYILQFLSPNPKLSIQCRILYYKSLMYLLISHPTLFTQETVAGILQMVIATYQDEQSYHPNQLLASSVIILIALTCFNLPIDDTVLTSCLSVAPSIDDDCMPIFVHCLILIYQARPELRDNNLLAKLALNAVASSDWCISKIASTEFQFLIEFIKSDLTAESIPPLLEYNQSLILKIQQKLA